MVAKKDAGNQALVACGEPWVIIKIPFRRKAIRVENVTGFSFSRIVEWGNFAHNVPRRARLGNHAFNRSLSDHGAGYVADPDEAHEMFRMVEASYRSGSPARRSESSVDGLHLIDRVKPGIITEYLRRRLSGLRSMPTMPRSVCH